MHADLSRVTFRPDRHYSAVIAQQGRVQLDADANEQAAIQLHLARTIAADLIGQEGGPRGAAGFRVDFVPGNREVDDLAIGAGRYYVDGILCDATRPRPGIAVGDDGESTVDAAWIGPGAAGPGGAGGPGGPGGAGGAGAAGAAGESGDAGRREPPATWTYWDQPDAFRDPERHGDRLPARFPFLAYLKVWERSVTAAEDPALREVALGSAMPDTTARSKVVWQVLALEGSELGLDGDGGGDVPKETVRAAFRRWVEKNGTPGCLMAARSERPDRADDDPCLIAPDARYRGPENQLYRVEIHEGGEGGAAGSATFKWSRENGSVVLPVDGLDGTWVELGSPGGDDRLGLGVGDRVELVDTAYASRLEPLPLLRVEEVDLPGRRVRLSGEPDPQVGRRPELGPFLRRWDHREGPRQGRHGTGWPQRGGALPVEEGRWLPLEDGVEVYFGTKGRYRSGDFWLVPARTPTGSVEWPVNAARTPLLQGPAGVRVHYAPLAWVMGEKTVSDLRQVFGPLAGPVPAATEEELAAEAAAAAEEEGRDADGAGAGVRAEGTEG